MNAQETKRQADAAARVPALVARFNGQIKYLPILLDHPEWTDDECIAMAQHWDKVARDRYSGKERDRWNAGIPYCRNIFKVT
ncbi:MAG: hypothetical protein ACREQF_01600 [Candidatus Binataceae bacterium]